MLVLAWFAGYPAVVRQTAAAADPVIATAGDIACDPADTHLNGGNGIVSQCAEKAVSNLLVSQSFAAVLSLGDNQYYCGSLAAYNSVYGPTWGRVKSITHPVVGNHEYLTAPGTTAATGCDTSNTGAAGYFSYFGSAAGTAGQGYYSYNVGAWHLIAINSNCGDAGGCGPTSPQGKWLAADLAAHTGQCLLAYWHIPLFSSGGRASPNTLPIWNQLYAAHADVVLDGHDHIYERFSPQTPTGAADPTNGIRQFTVGTGGANHTTITGIAANSVVTNVDSFGILKMTLHQGSYDWSFQPATGSFTDSGSAACHNASSAPTPTPTASPTGSATATPTATPTASPISGQGGTFTFTPVADSYVDASAPTTNHGTATTLRVDASPVVRSYLRFNLAGVTGTVASATLRIMPTSSQSTGYTASSVSDSTWGESTITNANAPPFGASLGASGPATAGTWTNVNVTTAVTGNGLVSFGLSTTNSTALSLTSREGANPPQLVVTTVGSTPTPTPVVTPSPTPVVTPTPTPVDTPTPTPVDTPTPTPVVTPSPTPIVTPSPTPIVTPSPTPVVTPSPTPIVTPTPTPSPGTTTLTPVADSYVDASAPTTNHGTTTTIRVDGSPVVRSYLRFNVAGLTGAATSATLRVWANSAQSTGCDVFGVADNTWAETAITASTAPPFGAKIGSSGAVATGTWTSVNVTSAVSASGPISFGLSTTNSTALSLSSREGANAPQLIITGPGIAALAPPVAPSAPNGPGPLYALIYLLIPALVPGVILLDSRASRRGLGGWRIRAPRPGLLSAVSAALAPRYAGPRRQASPTADSQL